MRRSAREYSHNGLAGCVTQRKARQTGTLVGVYQANQAGMESDPETPWATVCEEHGNLVCHPTLAFAMGHAADPQGWCEDCRVPADELARLAAEKTA